MTIVANRSKAYKVWLAVLAVVLTVLFFETSKPGGSEHNFVLGGDSECVGAQVLVDGVPLGDGNQTMMRRAGHSGLGGSIFWGHVAGGKHQVQVIKKGYRTFEKEFVMDREEYLPVSLERKSGG